MQSDYAHVISIDFRIIITTFFLSLATDAGTPYIGKLAYPYNLPFPYA